EVLRQPSGLAGGDEWLALAVRRLELEPDVAVLAAAARLLDELAFGLERLLERLAVGDLRLADGGLDAELALHAVDDDLEVQLAHARNDGLARLLVGAHAERRVLLRKTPERHAHLLLVDLGLGLDRLRDHGLGEFHPLQRDDLLDVADRLAGDDVLEPDYGGNVAGAHFLDLLALVGVHLQQATDALFLAAHRGINRIARAQYSRVHADERELTDERAGHDLERERGERLVFAGLAESGLALSFPPFTGGIFIDQGK